MNSGKLPSRQINEDGREVAVSDNNVDQSSLDMIRELRKMNLQLEVMTGEKFKDGDYDAPN